MLNVEVNRWELHVLMGTKHDNDLSLCFGNLIRRNIVLTDHVTASSYLYEPLLCNNSLTYSFFKEIRPDTIYYLFSS